MREINRQLIDSNSDTSLSLTLRSKTLVTETAKSGKVKTTTKEFSTDEESLKTFYKKEWEALKKGFVLRNDNAKTGQAFLHKFIGGGYTGALSFEGTTKGIYIYKNVGQEVKLIDKLVVIDEVGNLIEEIDLPECLAWNIEYRKETNSLMLDIDHFIYEFDTVNKKFRNIGIENRNQASFVSVANGKSAFATADVLSVVDQTNSVSFTRQYAIEVVKGSTPFCGKLSPDGKLLAFHHQVGKIQILDTTNGNLLHELSGDFEMVDQVAFAENNKLLIVRGRYGRGGLKYFTLSTLEEIKFNDLDIPEYTKDVNHFCFNDDQTKLVLVQRTNAYVFDFVEKKYLHSFKIEHLVKSCNIKFIGEKLGVRTDYGCFSLYGV